MRKGDTIGGFLKAVREQLAPQFRELRAVSADSLMYIKVSQGGAHPQAALAGVAAVEWRGVTCQVDHRRRLAAACGTLAQVVGCLEVVECSTTLQLPSSSRQLSRDSQRMSLAARRRI